MNIGSYRGVAIPLPFNTRYQFGDKRTLFIKIAPNSGSKDVLQRLEVPGVNGFISVNGTLRGMVPETARDIRNLFRYTAEAANNNGLLVVDDGMKNGFGGINGYWRTFNDYRRYPLLGILAGGSLEPPSIAVGPVINQTSATFDINRFDLDHTHLIAVGDGPWGTENGFYLQMLKDLTESGIPGLAVLCGGEVSVALRTFAAMQYGVPLAVFEGCGGFSDKISRAYKEQLYDTGNPIETNIIKWMFQYRISVYFISTQDEPYFRDLVFGVGPQAPQS